MEQIKFDRIENIETYIRFKDSVAICICLSKNKKCPRRCLKTTVKRDRYGDWRDVATVDKYGLCSKLFTDEE